MDANSWETGSPNESTAFSKRPPARQARGSQSHGGDQSIHGPDETISIPSSSHTQNNNGPTNQNTGLDSTQPQQNVSFTPPRVFLPTSRAHSGWEASGIPMAKCDLCDKRCRGTVHKCIECRLSVCQTCCKEGRLENDSKHSLNHESVCWDAHIKAKEAKQDTADTGPKSRRGRPRGGMRGRRARAGKSMTPRASPPVYVEAPVLAEEREVAEESSSSSSLSATAMAALAVPIRQYTEDASSASVTPTFLPSHDPLPGPSAPRNPLSYPSLGSSPKLPQYPHPSRDAVHPNRLPLAGQFAPMARPSSRPPPNRAAYRHHPYGVRPSTSGPAPGYSGEQMQHHNQQVAPYPTRGRGALEPQVHVGPPESYDMTRRLQERFRFGPPGPYPAITRNGDFPPNFRGLGRPASLYPAAACRRPNEDFDECPIVDELRHDLCDQVHATQQQFPDWSSEECLFHEVSRAWFHGKIGILKRTSEEWAFKLLVAIAENAVISLSIPRPNRVHRWLGDKEKELVARDVMAPLTHAVARFLPRVHLNS